MLEEYLKELSIWNKAHNLVSKNENLQEHLDDSLSLCDYARDFDYVLDIGSGGGFPVVPLAIVFRDKEFTATDVVDKKLAFLRWCAAKFGLNLEALNPDRGLLIEREGLITSRAFSSVENIIAWRDRHAPNMGEFALLKGGGVSQELQDAGIENYELQKNPRGFVVRFSHYGSL